MFTKETIGVKLTQNKILFFLVFLKFIFYKVSEGFSLVRPETNSISLNALRSD